MSNNEETDKMLLLRAAMSNEATAIVVNATDVFLLLVYDSGQLEICSEPWYIKIDSNQVTNINIIYNNLESETLHEK